MTTYLNSNYDLNSDTLIELLDELPLWSAPFGLRLLENIKLKKNITALDIGFGAGFPLTELALRLGDSCKVFGIDPWESAIKRVEKKIEFYGIKNIEIICGVSENIPLADNTIDLITSNNGINNVDNQAKTLSECARVLKSGGQFVQTVNLNTTMKEFYDILRIVLINFKMESEAKKIDEHIYEKRKPLDEFTELIKFYDFSIENVILDKFEYKFVDGTTMFNHYFIHLAFLEGWKSIIPADRQIEVFSRVEKLINQKAEKDGIFKLSVPFVLIDCRKN